MKRQFLVRKKFEIQSRRRRRIGSKKISWFGGEQFDGVLSRIVVISQCGILPWVEKRQSSRRKKIKKCEKKF